MFERLAQTFDDILDYIAPRNDDNRGDRNSNATTPRERIIIPENPHDCHDPIQSDQGNTDEELARKMQFEEDRKRELLRAQFDEESMAEGNGHFCKRQRVMYHHRAEDSFYEALIIGVHFDDGPNKPYYTIRYEKPESSESKKDLIIEKQTTPDRLSRLPWDEEKTWLIIK